MLMTCFGLFWSTRIIFWILSATVLPFMYADSLFISDHRDHEGEARKAPSISIKKTAPMDLIRVVFGAVGELIPEKTVTQKSTGGTRFWHRCSSNTFSPVFMFLFHLCHIVQSIRNFFLEGLPFMFLQNSLTIASFSYNFATFLQVFSLRFLHHFVTFSDISWPLFLHFLLLAFSFDVLGL